jgi:hypothetical protein
LLFFTVEKMDNDVLRFAMYVLRLLEKNEMTYER